MMASASPFWASYFHVFQSFSAVVVRPTACIIICGGQTGSHNSGQSSLFLLLSGVKSRRSCETLAGSGYFKINTCRESKKVPKKETDIRTIQYRQTCKSLKDANNATTDRIGKRVASMFGCMAFQHWQHYQTVMSMQQPQRCRPVAHCMIPTRRKRILVTRPAVPTNDKDRVSHHVVSDKKFASQSSSQQQQVEGEGVLRLVLRKTQYIPYYTMVVSIFFSIIPIEPQYTQVFTCCSGSPPSGPFRRISSAFRSQPFPGRSFPPCADAQS